MLYEVITPVDAEGNPFWPGIFRRNPQTGEQIAGEFASDRDIYMEFTDANNQQGDVVGIEIHEMAYTYGRVYADVITSYSIHYTKLYEQINLFLPVSTKLMTLEDANQEGAIGSTGLMMELSIIVCRRNNFV